MKVLHLALALVFGLTLAACQPGPSSTESLAKAKTFMTTNAKVPGVVTLPSGLQYKIVRSGDPKGMKPQSADEVKVNYEGKLVSGEVFDSSYERGVPASMPLQALIPAWVEALQLMRPGDEWLLYVPPELGYGSDGSGSIPPNSALIFRIELLGVLPGPGRIGQG